MHGGSGCNQLTVESASQSRRLHRLTVGHFRRPVRFCSKGNTLVGDLFVCVCKGSTQTSTAFGRGEKRVFHPGLCKVWAAVRRRRAGRAYTGGYELLQRSSATRDWSYPANDNSNFCRRRSTQSYKGIIVRNRKRDERYQSRVGSLPFS